MAKSQTNAGTSAANTLINQANTQMPGVEAGFQNQMTSAGQQANQTFNAAQSGYTQQQQTGGYDPAQLANLRSQMATGYATGGYDPTQLANMRGNLQSMQATGGYDPTQLANIEAEQQGQYGGYQTMAQTGGFTPQQQQQYLNQATSGSTTTASNLAAAAARNAAASGGNAGAAIAQIQNQAGAQQADATNNAMVGLNQQINANRLAGLGGMGTVSGQQAGLQGSVAGARQNIAQQQAGLESGVAQGATNIQGQQAGLESGVASGVQGANAGMAGLYNTATGQLTAAGQQLLASMGLQYGTEAQGASILAQLSKNPGLFQTGFTDFTNFLSSI